jgi:hypothetical protein
MLLTKLLMLPVILLLLLAHLLLPLKLAVVVKVLLRKEETRVETEVRARSIKGLGEVGRNQNHVVSNDVSFRKAGNFLQTAN